jgi:hypothetical protein
VEEADEGESSSPQRGAIGGSARTSGAHGHGEHLSAER